MAPIAPLRSAQDFKPCVCRHNAYSRVASYTQCVWEFGINMKELKIQGLFTHRERSDEGSIWT